VIASLTACEHSSVLLAPRAARQPRRAVRTCSPPKPSLLVRRRGPLHRASGPLLPARLPAAGRLLRAARPSHNPSLPRPPLPRSAQRRRALGNADPFQLIAGFDRPNLHLTGGGRFSDAAAKRRRWFEAIAAAPSGIGPTIATRKAERGPRHRLCRLPGRRRGLPRASPRGAAASSSTAYIASAP